MSTTPRRRIGLAMMIALKATGPTDAAPARRTAVVTSIKTTELGQRGAGLSFGSRALTMQVWRNPKADVGSGNFAPLQGAKGALLTKITARKRPDRSPPGLTL